MRGWWRRARVAFAFFAAAAAAVAIDLWMRWILLVYRSDAPKRIAALNRGGRAWADAMFGIARRVMGMDVAVEGNVPASGRFLIVANHQSSLDIPFLMSTFRSLNLKFVAMESLRHGKPVISLVIRHSGFVCVGKKNVGEDLAALTRFASELPAFDGSPVIFPAGGLERDQGARRFYLAGIEVLRRGSRLPILPVAIDGMAAAPTIGGLALLDGVRVRMRIFDPIPFEDAGADPRGTYESIEERIYAAVASFRGD